MHDLFGDRRVVALLVVLVGGWLFLVVTTPKNVTMEKLETGMCIHVPTSANGDPGAPMPIGVSGEVTGVLAYQGAVMAPCDSSHSHEVAGVFTAPGAVGAPYPGPAVLIEQARPTCEAAFASYVGHPLDGSIFELTIAVPSSDTWAQARRAGACLVSRADGQFMTAKAGGSGK